MLKYHKYIFVLKNKTIPFPLSLLSSFILLAVWLPFCWNSQHLSIKDSWFRNPQMFPSLVWALYLRWRSHRRWAHARASAWLSHTAYIWSLKQSCDCSLTRRCSSWGSETLDGLTITAQLELKRTSPASSFPRARGSLLDVFETVILFQRRGIVVLKELSVVIIIMGLALGMDFWL